MGSIATKGVQESPGSCGIGSRTLDTVSSLGVRGPGKMESEYRWPSAFASWHRLHVAVGPETINLGNCHRALFSTLRASKGVSEDYLLSLRSVI